MSYAVLTYVATATLLRSTHRTHIIIKRNGSVISTTYTACKMSSTDNNMDARNVRISRVREREVVAGIHL